MAQAPFKFNQVTSLRESNLKPSVRGVGGGRVYRNVTLIRAGLGNRRDMNFYPDAALREAANEGKFEGLKAYADHPTSVDEQIQPERTVRDFVGLYENTRFREGVRGRPGRVVGDLRILKAHRWLSDVVDELIEIKHADKIGISINGNGKTERKNVREAGEELEANVVSKFVLLKSADIVTEAGAGGGFQQILESARGASKEKPMNRKEIMAALREAADAGDTDKVKDLTTQLEECGCEDAAAPKGKAAKKGKVNGTRMVAQQEAAADEDDDPDDQDDDDPDRDLDEATDDAKDEYADDDEEADDDDDVDGDDVDDTEEADAEPADENERQARHARRAVDRLRQHAAGSRNGEKNDKPTRENAIQGYSHGGKKKKNLLGVPNSGTGSFNKRAGGGHRGQPGRRYAEAEGEPNISGVNRLELRDEIASLKRKLQKTSQRNERLAEALGAHRRADLARKLLKESDIAPELRPTLVQRLVTNCPSGDLREAERYMRKEIEFHQRLVESAAARAAESMDEFDDVEGAGSRFRESYGGGDESGNEFVDIFRESGLPIRTKAAK